MYPVEIAPRARLDVGFEHLWRHLAIGGIGSLVLLISILVVMQVGRPLGGDWVEIVRAIPAVLGYTLLSCIGAAIVGVMRIPVLRWVGQRARQQQWPVAWLLLASAALFLAPILPVFLFGLGGRYIGLVSLFLSFPFFISYVWATYRLRQHYYAPPQPGAA